MWVPVKTTALYSSIATLQKQIWLIATKSYQFYPNLLTSVTRAENGFSHAYILMILMPDTTSFMMRILLSVRTAVLLLQRIKMYMNIILFVMLGNIYISDQRSAVSLPEDAEELSKTGLYRHHEGHGCYTGQTWGADLVPEDNNDHHGLERSNQQVLQI